MDEQIYNELVTANTKLDSLIDEAVYQNTTLQEISGSLSAILQAQNDYHLMRWQIHVDEFKLYQDQIFLQNAILFGVAFGCGFCMYWLFKKNFYSFGTDLK